MKEKDLKDKSIVLPKRQKGDPVLSKDTLFIPSPWEFRLAIDNFGLKNTKACSIDFSSLYFLSPRIKRIALVGPAIGAPASVLILEKLIVLGVRNVFVLGSCGSLQDDIKIGDIIIPEEAIREEGTSFHYINDNFVPRASGKMIGLISKICVEQGLNHEIGKVWTTDAPYRETIKKVEEHKKQDILGVDMELSALFTVASLRKINLGGILIVSDELSSLEWKRGFDSKRFKASFNDGCRIVLEAVERLC